MATEWDPIAFRVAYDGAPFHGFQRQPDVETVEGALGTAFEALDLATDPFRTLEYAAAGRTDAGVSAIEQTIRIIGPAWLTPSVLNGKLPDSVHVWASTAVDPSFHPRYDAIERVYEYWLGATCLDLSTMRTAASSMIGTHDFRDLSANSEQTVRTVTAVDIEQADDGLLIVVAAEGFLHQQVRRMVTVLHEIGSGDREPTCIDPILDPTIEIDGPAGVPPAPAPGLLLRHVRYPDIVFSVDHDARDRAVKSFGARSQAIYTRWRTLDRLTMELQRDQQS